MRDGNRHPADLILQALDEVNPRAMAYSELCERTSLSVDLLEENVEALEKQGKLQTHQDGHGDVFITLN